MRIFASLLLLLFVTSLSARTAQHYLPDGADPDPAIPTPESVLGWDVGEWHVSHDKLVQYMQALAAASPRVSIKVIGETYEQRPLLQLAITSDKNQQQLEALRQQHLDGNGPLVVWLGYSVHGDEPSGSNASMLAAYYLASSRSKYVEELLAESIILIDPSINPDGLNRFASWANSNAGRAPVADPVTRQHVQDWPKGRTNHYFFDLNRDWLPLVHPSSRARISEYHRWLPHVLTDHHEQTGYPGFFFQPGVPTRQNPLTPKENLTLTRALAKYHSRAMDQVGQPHFTEDAYDDFYYGKGSTYPDINGSIGILFEQKAILGQELSTTNGTETFEMAVANHLRMSLSTLQGSWAMRDRLKSYQSGFHDEMMKRAQSRRFLAWVVGDDGDPERAKAFLEILDLHQIEYQALAENVRADSHEFTVGHGWVIPARQKQFALLEAIMEQRTRFQDNTFYDVSAWTLPLAYNLPFAALEALPRGQSEIASSQGVAPASGAAAWAIPWKQLGAPALLQELLAGGVKVRAAIKPFSAQTTNGLVAFAAGTLVVQAGIQPDGALQLSHEVLSRAALGGMDVKNLNSTMTIAGPDLGSKHFKIIQPVNPLLLGGAGTSSYSVGAQWFVLDYRLGIPTTMVNQHNLTNINLWDYTHLFMADGDYDALVNGKKSMVARWVKDGGILVAINRASDWAESLCYESSPDKCSTADARPADVEPDDAQPTTQRAYSEFADDKAKQVIGGAIVSTVLDLSHPMTFGYSRAELPLFRRGTTLLKPSNNPYSTPVHYTGDPLMAGFIGDERLDAFRSQPAVIAEKIGSGAVIRFANSPVFRGFWRGTERLFINALFFGQVIESTELPELTVPPKPETPRQQ